MSSNGYLAASELVAVPGGRLSAAAAKAWNAARAAALKENAVTLSIVQPQPSVVSNTPGSYRSYATQLDMRKRPGLYNITPGILPGLPSDHGFGTCVDVGAGLSWMIKNGGRFGFVRDKLSMGDTNHFHFSGTTSAGNDATPITNEETEEDMSFSLIPGTPGNPGVIFSLVTGLRENIQNTDHLEILKRVKKNDYNDPMLSSQLDIANFYLSKINPAPDVTATVTLSATDKADIVKQVVAAIPASKPQEFTAKITPVP